MDKRSVLFCCQPDWFENRSGMKNALPAGACSWIYETSSLTQRLKRGCGIQFRVALLRQVWVRPWPEEARILNAEANRYALVREVLLSCGKQALILARTIIPRDTLRGAQRKLSSLGTRPLGEVIFTYPSLKRHRLDIVKVQATDWNSCVRDRLSIQQPVWGRRTVYSIADRKLLVCEFFLPAVLKR